MYRGEIENELTKFVLKFKHLMRLARPKIPDPSTAMPTSRPDLQTEQKEKNDKRSKGRSNQTKLQ